ncbi:MAG: hypothetical protein V2I97_15625 [Desulfococcaceae bacterium]|jgi:hypothetical protein|nr:hypothetical protein [Desulfococcaceae bacterium]
MTQYFRDMKNFRSIFLLLALCMFLPAKGMGANPGENVWWIMGTVKGPKTGSTVITLRLVREGDSPENYVSVTSTNKYGQYAFSDPGKGLPPSAYKLYVYVGNNKVTDVGLAGVKRGGRVPPISIHW